MLASRTVLTIRSAIGVLLLCLAACGGASESDDPPAATDQADSPSAIETAAAPDAEAPAELLETPSSGDLLPMPFRVIWEPWHGDFDGMIERRIIRAVVPFGGYQFYYHDGLPRGASHELLQRFEQYVNDKLDRGNVKIFVVAIPVGRDELISAVLDGHADLVAADLTITADRSEQVQFLRPMLTQINEVVVTSPGTAPIESIDDLAGREIIVRESSSYFEHLQQLLPGFESRGLEPPTIHAADEILEAEDLLEMVNGGMIDITVMDDYKARFWAGVFPNIVVRDDLVVNEGGSIAWATRKDSPQLAATLQEFLRKFGKGTMIGNDTYNRHLADASRVRCSYSGRSAQERTELVGAFRKYGEKYDFDWLMLAAQGQQESGLRQNRKSPAGAIGVMQIKPSTAADKNVGIDDISTIDSNVHAGAKYMRFLADRYFDSEDINDLNQWIFSLAAYNAGPAKIARYRREAAENGYDPNRWFQNVEIIAARRIGRETVTYVSNVFKYYVGYQLAVERDTLRQERHGEVLEGCVADSSN
jgi:membrane-bound lytic murein transglycosylase MltF